MMNKNSVAIINNYESYFYFFTWSCSIVYSVYQLYLSTSYFDNYYDTYHDFNSGWSWVGKTQDISDQEWNVWLTLVYKLVPYVFIHHFISQIIKVRSNNTILCSWYILSSSIFLFYYLGICGVLCIVQPSLLHILTCIYSKSKAWFIHVSFLFAIHLLKIPNGTFQRLLQLTDEQHYILAITMCWIHLRSISHNMDTIDDQSSTTNNFIQKLAYCLYLPTLFCGPLILYHEFVDSINQSHQYWNWQKLQIFVINLIRYMFWLYVTELLLHFIYVNALQYHLHEVQNLNSWALYGFGYSMGQFFLNKYVVIYGTCSNLCNLDDMKAPPQPKCIARIHLYSDMWKYFDRGLYNFLVRYIYIPTRRISNGGFGKLFASFLTFTFVFIWHGMQINIFIWSLLNFIGVTIENIGVLISKTKQYQKIQNTYLSSRNAKRFHCILASPLLIMSAISNMYFFGGQEIGNIFVRNVLYGSWKALFILLFIIYCGCHVSLDVKNWELRRVKK